LFLKSSDHSFYHIGTKTDQIVVPYTSSFLGSDPARQCLFDDLGHASLLFSPRVTGKIYQWINESNCRK
jgi:hypothetical protein